MSCSNSIKNLINIKDNNIYFDDNCVSDTFINGIFAKVISTYLSYLPDYCPICGTFHPKLYSKGYSKPSLVRIPNISNMTAYLKLRKKRFECFECNKTFTLSTNIVSSNCFISNHTKTSIALAFTKVISAKDIAADHNVSSNTVARVLNSSFNPQKKFVNKLPKTLLFDEFKSVKNAKGAMSFIFVDGDSRKIVDIIENRQLPELIKYFSRFSHKTRASVKNIVIDMYMPYFVLIKKLFSNANIIIDRFHIIQHLNRALNKTRIKLLKKYPKEYSKLKRYWRQLLMFEDDLNDTNYYYHRTFKKMITTKQIVEYISNIDEEYKATYKIYQEILRSFKYQNKNRFDRAIDNVSSNVSEYMKTALKTLKGYRKLVLESMVSKYTNGPIEGINNKIKVIKRVSYGYRSFINFKLRIMICFNLIKKA